MTSKRLGCIVVGVVGVIALLTSVTVHFLPRQYYRYHAGSVYLVDNPTVCWNGLWKAPTLEFSVPLFANARTWTPAPEQVRQQLSQFHESLTEQEVAGIIQACVPCGGAE